MHKGTSMINMAIDRRDLGHPVNWNASWTVDLDTGTKLWNWLGRLYFDLPQSCYPPDEISGVKCRRRTDEFKLPHKKGWREYTVQNIPKRMQPLKNCSWETTCFSRYNVFGRQFFKKWHMAWEDEGPKAGQSHSLEGNARLPYFVYISKLWCLHGCVHTPRFSLQEWRIFQSLLRMEKPRSDWFSTVHRKMVHQVVRRSGWDLPPAQRRAPTSCGGSSVRRGAKRQCQSRKANTFSESFLLCTCM